MTASLLVVVAFAILFDYINGFHDTANAIATSVATRALRPQHAILMAAAFNFIGAFAGTAVAKTIGAGLVNEATTTQTIVVAALVGAIAWNLLTWRLGIPSSSSHALIGALLGATILAAGTGAVKWSGLVDKVLIPLVSSPVLGFIIAFFLMIALEMTCVVETGIPKCAVASSTVAAVVSAAKPWIGSSSTTRRPIVRMIRQPPTAVPREMALAAITITQTGTSTVGMTPAEKSARVTIPMVFCASLEPWLKAM